MKTIGSLRTRRQTAPRPIRHGGRAFDSTFEFLGQVGHCAAATSEIAAAMMLLGPVSPDDSHADRR